MYFNLLSPYKIDFGISPYKYIMCTVHSCKFHQDRFLFVFFNPFPILSSPLVTSKDTTCTLPLVYSLGASKSYKLNKESQICIEY